MHLARLWDTCYNYFKTFLPWSSQGLEILTQSVLNPRPPRPPPEEAAKNDILGTAPGGKSALSWKALESHWHSHDCGESQGQCLEGDTFATCIELLKTNSWGRTDPLSDTGLCSFAAGLVAESMAWLSGAVWWKRRGVSRTLPRGDLDVSQSEASAGNLAQSHGDGRWEVREKAHQFILVVTISLVLPWKNQSFFTLITKVVNIYCRKHLL